MYLLILVILWMLIIFLFSFQNKEESKKTSDGFIIKVCNIFIRNNFKNWFISWNNFLNMLLLSIRIIRNKDEFIFNLKINGIHNIIKKMNYNNKIEMFPSNIIASLFKFKEEAFFEASETERENVTVKF